MKTYKFKGMEVIVKVITSITPNRIQLHEASDGSPYATATSSLTVLDGIDGYVAVRDYNENEGMLHFLTMNDIVDEPSTYVEENSINFPICKLK
jgi:hypothetical protein